MLDIRFIRDQLDAVRAGAALKRIEVDLDRLVEVDDERRRLLHAMESGKAEQRRRSKALGKLSADERALEVAALGELKTEIQGHESELATVLADYEALMLRVPNVPSPDVPAGVDDRDNVELRTWGEVPSFDFEPRSHLALGEALALFDIERGVKLSGTRFYVLRGDGARLHRAVINLALDHMIAKGFEPMEVPVLVRDAAMFGTAYFPGGEEQAYRIDKDQLNLVGTAEVPLTSFHAGEILDPERLPIRFVARSPCFRREAGAAGKDTKGLYRIHQFEKVEQVVILAPDDAASVAEHEAILRNSEEVLRLLELPYRVVNVCGGDLGLPQVQKFDIETWMPSRGHYGETHSASRFGDFQARRLELRTRDEQGRPTFCHTLNNTVVASPRILIPLLEVHQQADGSVHVPEALRPYLGGQTTLGTPA